MLTRHQIYFLVMRAHQILASDAPDRHKEPAELIRECADKIADLHNMTLGEWLCPRAPQIHTDTWRASNDG